MFYPTFFSLSFNIAAILSAAQSTRLSTIGIRDWARGVREYSTLGGTSAYTWRRIKPSSSKVRSVLVSIFCEMSGINLRRALKRRGSSGCFSYIKMTSIDHLSHIRANTLRIGHSGNIGSLIAFAIVIYLLIVFTPLSTHQSSPSSRRSYNRSCGCDESRMHILWHIPWP